VVFGLSRCSERPEGAAVKSVLKRDDPISILSRTVQPCQLDGRFIGFSTTVAEERFAKTTTAEKFSKSPLLLDVPRVRYMNQPRCLLLNGLHQPRR